MDHKKLDVWKKGIEFVSRIYKVTETFPKAEICGLTNQLRRAAVSVPSNIAEGAARSSDREIVQFIYIAMGSLAETETQIIISTKLGYLKEDKSILEEVETLRKMLSGLIRYLKNK